MAIENNAAADVHTIKMSADGTVVRMDYSSLTDELLLTLAFQITQDPEAWMCRFNDIVAIHGAEQRGFRVQGHSVREILTEIYAHTAVPVVTLSTDQAFKHASAMDKVAGMADAAARPQPTNATPPAVMAQVRPIPDPSEGTPVFDAVKANHG